MERIKHLLRVARWLWEHKSEPNNRAKYRRMMRELSKEIED